MTGILSVMNDGRERQPSPLSYVEEQQSRLRSDVEAVRAYGETQPEEWVDLAFENEPTVRILAYFHSENIRTHETALRELVEYPDQLEVLWVPYPRSYLLEIRDAVRSLADAKEKGTFKSWGIQRDRVRVALGAGALDVAAQLLDLYGDAVAIQVGYKRFPECTPIHDTPPTARRSQRQLPLLPREFLVTTTTDLVVRAGLSLSSFIRFENQGNEDVIISRGVPSTRTVDPTSGKGVGGYEGAVALLLVQYRVEPHQTHDIPVLIGTASSGFDGRYSVPPGDWAIEVVLKIDGRGTFRTPSLPLTITE